ncbi:sensor histidine kinase [Paenibacillaceae bacterium]|nr:sensor histidine kinase [Paenibacillaceae bacterium]
MRGHRPIFVKMIGILLFLLSSVVVLYTYFSQSSIEVIDAQITANNESRVSFLREQMESNMERLALTSGVLTQDSSIAKLQISILTGKDYDTLQYQTQVKEKLQLQSLSGNWRNEMSIYLPESGTRITTNPETPYDPELLSNSENGVWQLKKNGNGDPAYYQMLTWEPFLSKEHPEHANAVFEVRFDLNNLRQMLRNYKLDDPGDVYLVAEGTQWIDRTGKNVDPAVTADARAAIGAALQSEVDHPERTVGHLEVDIGGQSAFLSYARIAGLDAYLVDYVPLRVMHQPIIASRNLFYISLAFVVALGIAATYLLYMHVQKPISAIVRGLKKFEIGDYSFRIRKRFNNEFDYMMVRFNDMGEEIQHLIRDVYEERDRARLATLKQLQSQINPHFLYNCLSFVAGCAKIGQTETIRQMAFHLGSYYRYTTRVENQLPLLREEIDLVTHYLTIYCLRLERLDYEIDLDDSLLEEHVLRLILQPIVENAIVHGVEPVAGGGMICISGQRDGEDLVLSVEDSGRGMTEKEIAQYRERLNTPLNESGGCGLWNVNQRLLHRYGEGAGLTMAPSQRLSGLRVTVRWPSGSGGTAEQEMGNQLDKQDIEGGEHHAAIAVSG